MIYSSPVVYSFGNRPKTTSQNFINTRNPLGPGQYSLPNQKVYKKSVKTFSFGKDAIKSSTLVLENMRAILVLLEKMLLNIQ